ncbi:energy transducer TonB [Burkholderia lata]|uniref:Cell envelope biogenesis protein TonB n=1 Tax=Burkholderia contaminans TaxID=488447 RepID=A0A6P3BXS7_9BURK|nr:MULTISPECIES: energy transducer TonB [Burkholderia]AOJ37286.1 energy transducer TonB [Burkholderia lata]OXJ38482.1 energy transducer TonB [Burkholderia sp. HI2714]VWD63563.1 cell envelope biogenesis protein TonB [Burkholderia contaminans]
MRPLPRLHVDRLRAVALVVVAMLAACTITPPPSLHSILTIPSITRSGNLDQYRVEVAHRVAERNPSGMLHGVPQAMLRSLVVVAFTVDGSGRLVNASVYRSNGDSEAEALALASLRRSAPLPPPPSRLLDGNGRLEMMEGWLFNDDGHFQLQSTASAQAQSID